MAQSDSFDPRTWQGSDPAPVKAADPVHQPAPKPPGPRGWLGLALSAAILAGGAVAAYTTRADIPAETVTSVAD